MNLPGADVSYLSGLSIEFDVRAEGGMTCVVLRGWSLPSGFNRSSSDLLVRLPGGYPDVAPDMWWFSPPVHTESGTSLPNTETTEHHLGCNWQRWSRHLQPGQWQSGVDGLESYVALIRNELERSTLAAVR